MSQPPRSCPAEQPSKFLAMRLSYHKALMGRCIRIGESGVPNMADKSNRSSASIAKAMVALISSEVSSGKFTPQALGATFAEITADFLRTSFASLGHIRPGTWSFSTSQGEGGISRFAQYAHITTLQRVLNQNPELRSSLGGDYLITPDIVLFRDPVSDEAINAQDVLVKAGENVAAKSPLRHGNILGSPSLLHASVSVKWSIRSDRAQNARTEALNLIRNRKGPTPRICVVTLEPLPARLASIAMGTGDIDCTYHGALPELMAAAEQVDKDGGQCDLLQMLVEGQRLRDISDLPLDLAT